MANLIEKQYKDNKGPSLTQQDIQGSKLDEFIEKNLKSVGKTIHAYDDQGTTVIANVSYSSKEIKDLEKKIDEFSQKLTGEITDIKIALSGFMVNLVKIEQTILENSEKLLYELNLRKETTKMINEKSKKKN
jgi:hypothetical protein